MRTSIPVVLALVAAACQSTSGKEPAFEVRAIVIDAPAELAQSLRGESDVQVGPTNHIAALQLEPTAHVTSRPRIVTREGQRAEIANESKVPYVKDVELDAQGVPRPVQGELEEGLRIAVTPRRADGGRIELECEVKTSDVLRPIRTSTLRPTGADHDVTIDLPEVDHHRWASRVRVGPNESVSVVFAAPARDGQRWVRIVALSCDPVASPEGE